MNKLTQNNLQLYYVSNVLLYRMWSMFHNREIDNVIVDSWMKGLHDQHLIYNSTVIFDETIWLPSNPEDYKRVIKIQYTLTPMDDYKIYNIDYNSNTSNEDMSKLFPYWDCSGITDSEYTFI